MSAEAENGSGQLLGALPPEPNQLFRLHRLCVRLFSQLTKDLAEQVEAVVEAAGGSWRKQKQALGQVLEAELPILILLRVLDGLEKDDRLDQPGLLDLLRGLLLPLFSICFARLHDHPSEQLKRVLSRIDWYLDFDSDDPVEAFAAYCAAESGPALKDRAALVAWLREKFMPEVDLRLRNTLRQEFV